MEKLEGREIEREARFDVSNTCTFLDLSLRYYGSATSRDTIDMIKRHDLHPGTTKAPLRPRSMNDMGDCFTFIYRALSLMNLSCA